MKDMKSDSWIVAECLAALTILGIFCVFFEPKYALGLMAVLTAIISMLNNAQGSKTGGKMPQQAGDPKPGQQSTSEVTTTSADSAAGKP